MPGQGIAVSEGFGYLLDPGLREVFWGEYNAIASLIPSLFNVQGSDKAVEYDLGIGDMSDFENFSNIGKVQYDTPEQLWRVSYTHTEYAKGFQIERKLFEDNLYSVMNDRAVDLGRSAWRTREKKGASMFNNATTTAGYDGVALVSNSHPLSPSNASVQDNYFALALSSANLSTVRLAMMKFTDDRGNLANVMPDLLLVPPELEETAWQIVENPTRYQPGSANLTAEFHQGRYQILPWNQLTDTNRWFLIDSRLMRRFVKWYDRVPLEFANIEDFDTLVAKWRAYMRFSFGWSDWRWIAGSEPS
jgi:phage major head subunit gpT-like protein